MTSKNTERLSYELLNPKLEFYKYGAHLIAQIKRLELEMMYLFFSIKDPETHLTEIERLNSEVRTFLSNMVS